MSSVDEEKFKAVMSSLQMGLDGTGIGFLDAGKMTIEDGLGKDKEKESERLKSIAQKKEEQLKEEFNQVEKFLGETDVNGTKLEEYITAIKTDEGVILRIDDVLLFDSGSAEMKSDSKTILGKIGELIRDSKGEVRVEGHTDNVPIKSARYASNWELSTSRATTVVEFLLKNNFIKPEKIAVSGYGEFRPVAPNDTRENKAKNRRVDIVLLSDFSEIEKE